MAISYVNVTSASNALVGGTSVALSTPAGTQGQDMMIAHVTLEAVGRTMTPPVGWAQLPVAVNESDHTHRIFWKQASGTAGVATTEPASRSWSWSGAGTAYTGILTSYRGVANIHGTTNVDGLTLLVHPGPIVSSYSDHAWLEVCSSGMSLLSLGWAPPAGMVERADVIGGLLVLLNVNACLDTQGPVGIGPHQRGTISLDLVAAINSLVVLEPVLEFQASQHRMTYATPSGFARGGGLQELMSTNPSADGFGYQSGGAMFQQQQNSVITVGPDGVRYCN